MSEFGSRSRHLDETAGNNVNMACSHGSVLAGDGGHYGDWSDFEICPENTAVCGIRTLGKISEKIGHFSQGLFSGGSTRNLYR